ncbi:hypothetical protein L211DRAFT_533983 [Terfezia boudieri ATCC MYA-4762]|uniref:Uncharacterized protein n=1 Tax=Terfezia boudieri ATCC MYA-4762 TaxID=1051890 RepID=A0A3N4M040_9PEZI|nr:hypothetical protein L211DRAFT_533983 [Terfezia boudieri ATCC MYA-4762]
MTAWGSASNESPWFSHFFGLFYTMLVGALLLTQLFSHIACLVSVRFLCCILYLVVLRAAGLAD